ncbi:MULTISPECIES: type VI secretion system tube protein TssD [Apibacter]|uniref:type VI secretion system tube protein TssD n=1 Tax=Apibacter TaxID=1778601 RepID=UPI0013246096|nr:MULTISPECIES: type VI secretion system tube protein TssD [Apibacter]MCX8677879.1 phage tail protein [Apibacter sp. B3919]MXO25168.1 phage tail protein [Apibacter sp. B3924]MXO27371.1 phage tail protein [Apibacter sp. B3813]MXO29184.1 phage tail protein [Apibacter sp. B3913]MXO31313.1 phage tail protein [Apibacter sp. B3912]
MSFRARLEVAGRKYNIINVNYSLAQETDPTGRPSAQIRGGRIEITLRSTNETRFFEWMTNSYEKKNGKVVFTKKDSNTPLKELNFTDGYVVKYKEKFDSLGLGRSSITETFTISAKAISMGLGEHVNEWIG